MSAIIQLAVGSVEEVLPRSGSDLPAVVLVDIGLPGKSGIEGIRLLNYWTLKEYANLLRLTTRKPLADKEIPPVIRSLWILMVLCVIPTASGQTTCDAGLPEIASTQKLNPHVYNLANVSPENLDRVIELAQSILAKAAVETCWDRGPADAAEAHFSNMTGAAPSQRLKPDDRGYLVVKITRGEPESANKETATWQNCKANSF